jgi:molybdenum cofactor biosynthesis protein B
MQHQNRPRLVLLLQALRHGCDLTFAEAGEVLQLQRLQRPAIHRGGPHPTDEDGRGRGIPTPERKLLPRIKGIRPHLHTAIGHASTPRERWKKGQLITGLQRLIGTDQLLVHRNADALQRAKIQLIPDLTGRRDAWCEGKGTIGPTGAFSQGSEQQHLQHHVHGSWSGSSVRGLRRCAMGLSIALLTISDTRTLADDSSGDQLQRSLEDAGHRLQERQLCPDDRYQIRRELSRWIADPAVDVVITSGGTGLTGRDGTPEAVAPLLDKTIEGFGELFRVLSFESIGTSTLQSRCLAGVANGTFVFVLPGSLDAVTTAWNRLIRAQLDADTRPCNLAQLRARLKE